jgi:hypothetical protein
MKVNLGFWKLTVFRVFATIAISRRPIKNCSVCWGTMTTADLPLAGSFFRFEKAKGVYHEDLKVVEFVEFIE